MGQIAPGDAKNSGPALCPYGSGAAAGVRSNVLTLPCRNTRVDGRRAASGTRRAAVLARRVALGDLTARVFSSPLLTAFSGRFYIGGGHQGVSANHRRCDAPGRHPRKVISPTSRDWRLVQMRRPTLRKALFPLVAWPTPLSGPRHFPARLSRHVQFGRSGLRHHHQGFTIRAASLATILASGRSAGGTAGAPDARRDPVLAGGGAQRRIAGFPPASGPGRYGSRCCPRPVRMTRSRLGSPRVRDNSTRVRSSDAMPASGCCFHRRHQSGAGRLRGWNATVIFCEF